MCAKKISRNSIENIPGFCKIYRNISNNLKFREVRIMRTEKKETSPKIVLLRFLIGSVNDI